MAQCKSIILLIIIFLLFISGCLNVVSEDVQNDSHSRSDSKTNGNDFEIIPLQVDRDEFQFVLGWLSNEEILYVKYMNGQYVIHSYNIHTGKELPIYSSEMPIIQGDISPSREFLFLHQRDQRMKLK